MNEEDVEDVSVVAIVKVGSEHSVWRWICTGHCIITHHSEEAADKLIQTYWRAAVTYRKGTV